MLIKMLRVEGLAVFLVATLFYGIIVAEWINHAWFLYFLLFLVPDISMIGYLKSQKLGAYLYNLGHSYVIPLVGITYASILDSHLFVGVFLIWVCHIGIDRAMGYGLKHDDNFKHTHLGWVGKKSIVSEENHGK